MSALRDLINMILAGYGRHIPCRDACYRYCNHSIEKRLNRRADVELGQSNFQDRLCSITKIPQNLFIDEEEKKRIIAAADKAVEGVFNLLGSGEKKLIPIPWSTDFISGFNWKPGTYYRKYTQVDLKNNADVKVPREISRCHHLLHLALAYHFTGDTRYAKTCVEHILDWIEKNPLMYSINWGCAMDVGIRAVNWIWALSLLKGYQYKEFHKKIYESLYQHGWYIYRNLEGTNWGYNNNHYFSDIVGLLHIALLFPEDKESKVWFGFAKSTFYRETRLQILPSGMLYEGSTNYHRLAVELVLSSVVLLKRNGEDVPPDIIGRMESMFDFVMQMTMPDGTMPIVGDQDNGRVLPWGIEDLNDHRYLLTVGAMLFNRADMKNFCSGYNIYAAIFAGSREEYERIKGEHIQLQSQLIRDAGFAILRKENNYFLFNVDNQGMYRDTGTSLSHTHCDWFSFVLASNGTTFIVDPGSYVYSSNAKARNEFRSTRMHNTVTVDGENQEKMPEKLLWAYGRKERPRLIKWSSNIKRDLIECEHDGYSWLGDSITHRRVIDYEKENLTWKIIDTIVCENNHKIAAHFHLAKNVEIINNGNIIVLRKNDNSLMLQFCCEEKIDVKVESSQVSNGYGELTESNEINVISTNKTNSFEFVTKIWLKKD